MPRFRLTPVLVPAIATAMAWSPAARADDLNCCCTPHASTSCTDAACSTTVCAIDPYCCSTQWDYTCASEAAQYCGATAPYCVDANQNNKPDVCENGGGGGGGGGDPSDCNGNGTPDLNEPGPSGYSLWQGATSGFGLMFEPNASWSAGRPGTATTARVGVPYSQYYNYLQMLMGCDNAVNGFELFDYGTYSLHDYELNLGGNTLRVAGQFSGFRFTPQLYNTLRATIASGTILGTDGGLFVVDDGALDITFSGTDLYASTFGWSSTTASVYANLTFENSNLDATAFSWPSPIQGSSIPATLKLRNSIIDISSPTGGSFFTVPADAALRIDSPGSFDLSKLSGTGLQVFTEQGSILDLNGRLTVEGSLNLGGQTFGRSHCIAQSQFCSPSLLTTQYLVYPTPNTKASIQWGIDLSGNSGTTPDGDASIRATTSAWVDGTLVVNDMSNGSPPALGFSVPLVWSNTFTPGHDNFDLVRVYGLGNMQLPAGYFVTTERNGNTISVVVKRADPIGSNTPAAAGLAAPPSKMTVVDQGAYFGLPLVAYATPAAGQGTTISLRKINSSQGTITQFASVFAPADLTDMIATDLTGDGKPELVASFGTPGLIRAYQITTAGAVTTLWTVQLQSGSRAECLCALPPSGQTFLPTGSSVGYGSSSGSKGSVGTISGTGTASGGTEVAVVPKTLDGTDIDNDGDSDVVAGGESTSSALTGSSTGAVQIMRRGVTGGWTLLPAVQVQGIPNALAAADLDGDGVKDVVASCGQITASFSTGNRPTGVVLRGAPVSGPGSTPSLLRAPAALDVGSAYSQGTGVSLVDGDGDGNLDIALSWQDTGSAVSGGAAIFPIREQRASGGLTLGSQFNFASSAVSQLRGLGTSSVVTVRANVSSLTDSSTLAQDDFAAAPILGDLDGDGFVTNADLALLLLDFGPCTSQPCEGDLDETGSVDNGDIAYLLLLFS